MLGLIKKKISTQAFMVIGSSLLWGGGDLSDQELSFDLTSNSQSASVIDVSNWQHFHSVPGQCKIAFPHSPEHSNQIMPFPEKGYDLRYDVYVAAYERQAVYMALITGYPPSMKGNLAETSLESFLNGLVIQNEDNKLIFADISDVQGCKALDFFIESKGVYFKGKAIMGKNNFYLIAMECEDHNYVHEHYTHFINSFEIVD